MSFHGSPRHVELAGDFGVVTALQQQFHDLLFARTETNSLLLHSFLPFFFGRLTRSVHGCTISNSHSIHVAILRRRAANQPQNSFPQPLADHQQASVNQDCGLRIHLERCTGRRSAAKTRENTQGHEACAAGALLGKVLNRFARVLVVDYRSGKRFASKIDWG
mgnify:CR=1 FL=1